jgi:glutamine amidotransferase-like uncharacterized protein
MKPTIALFVHHPECSVECSNGIIQSLSSEYNFKLFTKDYVENGFFDNVDMVAFPGGFGDSDRFERLLSKNKEQVIDFVNRGGRYLGICMGAYWAGKEYFNILDNVDAVQYITRPNTDTRRPHAKALAVNWQGQSERMYFYDGCALVGNGQYDTIATYSNGDAMAIVQNNIGLIGCHPESMPSWYNQYSYLHPHWHNGKHHKLLLDFVNFLFR